MDNFDDGHYSYDNFLYIQEGDRWSELLLTEAELYIVITWD